MQGVNAGSRVRPLSIEYLSDWYHVTCRGNEKRAIFQDDRDRERFLQILGEISTYSRSPQPSPNTRLSP